VGGFGKAVLPDPAGKKPRRSTRDNLKVFLSDHHLKRLVARMPPRARARNSPRLQSRDGSHEAGPKEAVASAMPEGDPGSGEMVPTVERDGSGAAAAASK
jgi:hypothetical protein